MLQPGQRFGWFTVLGLVGEGERGAVYRAEDNRLQRRVALRVLTAEVAGQALEEARAAMGIEHPNAVSIHDLGAVDGVSFIAMELVEGERMGSFVGDVEVPWEDKLRWLLDAAAALGAAHDVGLVHGDVKADKVIVRDDGRIKVLGIGGKAAKEGDDRADQLAWGVMAHELLAGEAPDAVVAAIQRALSTSPTDRFTSMGELIEALEPFAAPALPPASVPRPRRAWDNGSAARDRRAPAGRLRLYALLGTAACALGVTVFFRMRTEANHDAIPTVTMSSAIAMTALSLLDQPASSDVPAAAAAYVAGLQAEHEGNDEAAESSFLEAAAADPAMATAHLRYAIAAVTQHPAEAHTHFLGATAARSTLTEHDAALLDALAPLFDKEPPDWAEAERNLQLESSRRPNDAELRYELARVRLAQSKLPEAISAARGALTLDPRFTAARLLATRALERQSDSSGATLP